MAKSGRLPPLTLGGGHHESMTGWRRALAWTGAVVGSAAAVTLIVIAVAVDLDTAEKLGSLAGAVIALVTGVVSILRLTHSGAGSPPQPSTSSTGERSVVAGAAITGPVATGNRSRATSKRAARPVKRSAAPAQRGNAEAKAGRSVVAGEGIEGPVATGDDSTATQS